MYTNIYINTSTHIYIYIYIYMYYRWCIFRAWSLPAPGWGSETSSSPAQAAPSRSDRPGRRPILLSLPLIIYIYRYICIHVTRYTYIYIYTHIIDIVEGQRRHRGQAARSQGEGHARMPNALFNFISIITIMITQ